MVYVVGDPHGDFSRFQHLLKKIALQPTDHLYVLGDAIDRGPDGIQILRTIQASENITLLMGNHEYMMLQALSTERDPNAIKNWMVNGGSATYLEYKKLSQEEQLQLLHWLCELPIGVRVTVGDESFYLTHGWPGKTVKETVWGRPDSLRQENPMPDCTLVIGHTPVCLLAKGGMSTSRYLQYLEDQCAHMKILYAPGFVDMDTGCGHDIPMARLSCLRLNDKTEFYV